MSNINPTNGYTETFTKMFITTKRKLTNSTYNENYLDNMTSYLIYLKDYSSKTSISLYAGLIFVILFLLVLGYIIFAFNPYKILDYAQIPIIFIYLILLFYAIIYFLFILKKTKNNNQINLQFETKNFTSNYGKLLLTCILCLVTVLVVFFTFKSILMTSLSISSILYFIIIIIILAIFIKLFNLSDLDIDTNNHPIINLIKEVIFYIPCLLIDCIEYIIQDYKDTPQVTKILFILLVIISVIYFFTMFHKFDKNKNGIVIIDSPESLNKDIVSLDNIELKNMIIDSKPFYVKQLYKIQLKRQTERYNNDVIFDASANRVAPEIIRRIPSFADKISKHIYTSSEGFTSVLSEETIPVHLTIDEYDKYILQQLLWKNPEISKSIKEKEEQNQDVNEYIKSLIEKNKNLISYYEKSMLYLSTYFNKDYTLTIIDDVKGNNYQYSMSFWLFLNPNPTKNKNNILNEKDVIFKYGNRPSMYFLNSTQELTLEYVKKNNSETPTNIVLYKSNSILYQRWNNIVINNKNGDIDLFINGNLMGNYKNIVDYSIDNFELLEVGSIHNTDLGGIAEFYYYETPLKLNQISNLYKNQKSF